MRGVLHQRRLRHHFRYKEALTFRKTVDKEKESLNVAEKICRLVFIRRRKPI